MKQKTKYKLQNIIGNATMHAALKMNPSPSLCIPFFSAKFTEQLYMEIYYDTQLILHLRPYTDLFHLIDDFAHRTTTKLKFLQ